MSTKSNQRSIFSLLFTVLLILLATSVIAAVPSLQKPLIMDEIEFPAVANAIVATGMPIYYRGETNPNNVGLWHPPLYILVYAAWHYIFGASLISSRSFGLTTGCFAILSISFFVMYRLIIAGKWKGNSTKFMLAIAMGVMSVSTAPLFIQGSTLPDIDTQILPLTITAFLLTVFTARLYGPCSNIYRCTFIGMFAFNLFAKLTTPILLIPSFFMLELASLWYEKTTLLEHPKKNSTLTNKKSYFNYLNNINIVLQPIFLGLLGFVFLLISWMIVAAIWGVDYKTPFIYLTQSANNPASRGNGIVDIITIIIKNSPEHFRYLAQWFGLPAIFFLFLMIFREFTRPKSCFLSAPERITLYTYSLLLMLMYIILKPAPFEFPKYFPPLFPAVALLVMEFFANIASRNYFYTIIASILLGVSFYSLYILFNPSTNTHDFIHQIYWTAPRLPVFMAWILWPLGVAIALCSLFFIPQKRFFDGVIVSVFIVLMGWQISTTSVQSSLSYSTTYMYGEDSLRKVTEYLRAKLPEDAVIIAPKDVGNILEDRWRYIELDVDPRIYLDNHDVTYIVIRGNDYYGNTIRETPEVNTAIQGRFELEASIENFIVLRRRI